MRRLSLCARVCRVGCELPIRKREARDRVGASREGLGADAGVTLDLDLELFCFLVCFFVSLGGAVGVVGSAQKPPPAVCVGV